MSSSAMGNALWTCVHLIFIFVLYVHSTCFFLCCCVSFPNGILTINELMPSLSILFCFLQLPSPPPHIIRLCLLIFRVFLCIPLFLFPCGFQRKNFWMNVCNLVVIVLVVLHVYDSYNSRMCVNYCQMWLILGQNFMALTSWPHSRRYCSWLVVTETQLLLC